MKSSTDPMRILHVIPSLSLKRGGPSTVLPLVCTSLRDRGLHVTVATTNDDGPGHLDVPLGVEICDEGISTYYFRRLTRFYSYTPSLSAWLRSNISRFDVTHIHALFSHPSTSAAGIARRRRLPFVIRPLGTLSPWALENLHPKLKRLSLMMFERRLIQAAAAVHVTSETEAHEVQAAFPGARVILIPNPVSLQAEAPGPSRESTGEDGPLVLFLSRIDEKKGLDLLIDSLRIILERMPRVQLVIAGEGSPRYVTHLKERASNNRVDQNISWVGHVDGAQKAQLLRTANVFVLPSRSENFGVAVAEAMAIGCPVVVTTEVGLHSEIKATGAGVVADLTAGSLAAGIIQVLESAGSGLAMGERGREFVDQTLNPHAIAGKLEEMYRQIKEGGEYAKA